MFNHVDLDFINDLAETFIHVLASWNNKKKLTFFLPKQLEKPLTFPTKSTLSET